MHNAKKYADENCKECHGEGEVTIGEFDDVENVPCVCASTNRSEYEAEMRSDELVNDVKGITQSND